MAGHGGGCEHPGAGGGRKHTVTIDLTETTTGAIARALQQARQRLGGPASGMVLTLVIVTDETSQYDAVRAANEAAREHPCRVLVVITRRPTAASRLDAEIRVGETSPGETLLLRMYGPLGQHADSVVAPLLLPDTPVVTWWPGHATAVPAGDQTGDTDLSWTRATPWRSLLAAPLDQPHGTIQSATVRAEQGNPSADLIAVWLASRLQVPVVNEVSSGPGITEVSFATSEGEISVTRPDGRVALLNRPGQPERRVALRRRDAPELLAEELRRLDPDVMYAESLSLLGPV